jgi:hypothetical protein
MRLLRLHIGLEAAQSFLPEPVHSCPIEGALFWIGISVVRHRLPRNGEAKSWHGLARAVRRGVANMRIQPYLTAAINLKQQAVALLAPLVRWLGGTSRPTLGHCCATDAELATA